MPRYHLSKCLFLGGVGGRGDVSFVTGDVFSIGVGFVVGDGKVVSFWSDDWVGVGPWRFLFPIEWLPIKSLLCGIAVPRVEIMCPRLCPLGGPLVSWKRPNMGSC